jgi:dynein heavy chain
MDDHTMLEDLLQLNLHKYEEEVKTIVDKAVKETSMEKVLRELEITWAQMEFEHEEHPRTGVTLLKASDEVVETLEDNQVCLFTALTGDIGQVLNSQVTFPGSVAFCKTQ